ncbi:hypothetical protein [Rummeliibacillus suwonensis]|uniref:hypothetical protein n=1 Tax=Rummeliibacillus suwonensis TaxID=1306154 RepID=UPI0028980F78|nr:hypothetical protein [Rummeliibacillus suwonensis]
MKSYTSYSISSFSSVCDCQMILDELKHDLQEVSLSNEQLQAIKRILDNKKVEVEERYKK